MLVLTRKPQEVIHIGPNVTITIVRVSGNSVRIGIDAPLDVRVTRGELTADDPTERDNVRTETASANRLPRPGSMLARVKSLTVVESPAESIGFDSHVADSRLRNPRLCGFPPRSPDKLSVPQNNKYGNAEPS